MGIEQYTLSWVLPCYGQWAEGYSDVLEEVSCAWSSGRVEGMLPSQGRAGCLIPLWKGLGLHGLSHQV